MLTKAQAKELINLIQENRIAYFFEKIDEYEVKTTQINQLRQEFILGKYFFDYYERLQVFVNSIANTNFEIILPKYDIFFSFSSKNIADAQQNVITLRKCGLSIFFSDEELKKQAGHGFDKIIEKALKNSEHFLLFCTPEAMQSNWVEDEYRLFYNKYHRYDREKRRFFILEGVNFNTSILGDGFLGNIQTTTSIDDIVRILGRKTLEDYLSERKADYQDLFELFFEDNIISDRERKQLQAKQKALELTEEQIIEIENFVRSGKAEKARLAEILKKTSLLIEQVEVENEENSGGLALEEEVKNLADNAKNLDEGIFRLLVLGDMKQGKSTFLNALLGEKILPSDVNPCTAIFTKVRYGQRKGVTIHYKREEMTPLRMELEEFKKKYTIFGEEANKFDVAKTHAFPDVKEAIIEYPLEILKNGVEIIDSPSLNDTEDIVLDYLTECHAVFFVLNAVQLFTLDEKRYLKDYINKKDLSVFFLINAWDRIAVTLPDPDDIEELKKAENKVRRVYAEFLSDKIEAKKYKERVFEISALNELRLRLGKKLAVETGFKPFIASLDNFLSNERANVEFRKSKNLLKSCSESVRKKVGLRILLIKDSLEDLEKKIDLLSPQFDKLYETQKQILNVIIHAKEQIKREAKTSFYEYFRKANDSFEDDFFQYQPSLVFSDVFGGNKRKEFQKGMEEAFKKYLTDRFIDWSDQFGDEIHSYLENINDELRRQAIYYENITNYITQNLLVRDSVNKKKLLESTLRERLLMGGVAVLSGNITVGFLAGTHIFKWQDILLNVFVATFIEHISALIIPLIMSALSAEVRRRRFMSKLKEELPKLFNQILPKAISAIQDTIEKQFIDYEKEIQRSMHTDIDSHKKELSNLVEAEIKRLEEFRNQVEANYKKIDEIFEAMNLFRAVSSPELTDLLSQNHKSGFEKASITEK